MQEPFQRQHFFVDGSRRYALRLIRNGSREIPPRRSCSGLIGMIAGTNDVEWIHVLSSVVDYLHLL